MKSIFTMKNPNPQGKGLVPVLQELDSRQVSSHSNSSSSLARMLHDYALSRLILCAEFNFKPVANTAYYLYVKNQVLKLSLISPREWRDGRFGLYVCRCKLSESMVWEISEHNEDALVREQLLSAYAALKGTLLSDLFLDKPLESTLPYFDERLPFHRRVLANALATHLRHKIPTELEKSFVQLGRENHQGMGELAFLV